MANEPRKPFQSPAPLPLPTPQSSTKDKDKGGAALPLWTSGASSDKLAGMPLFRGAAQKSGGVLGRLKGLKTKDVAFIGAGLAVLVMAPLAEYLISEGEDKAGQLQGGFANNSSPFNEGRDPSEIGIMGLARGGIPGDGSDVITPLNARDPSSLIMGGTGEKQEAPAAASVEPKRDAPKDSVWDKVVSSAKSGASAATRKVSLPKPGGKLAGAINGLRSLSGGSTGASLKLSAPDSKGLFSSPKNQSSLAATQPVPGYRGAGSRSPAGGSGGNSTGRFGGGFGSPGGGAAGDVMSGGISGGGRGSGFSGGDGDPTKNPGGSSTKDAKTLGESLAFLRQKMEMEKAIDLKWAKKRYDELERKKMIEQTLVQTAQQAFMKVLDKLLEGKKDGAGSPGGGSPGGGSPGGGEKPPGGAGSTLGSVGNTPSGVEPGDGVARGAKAVPAATGAVTADKSVKSAASIHETSRGKVSTALSAFKPGTNGEDITAAAERVKAAAGEGTKLTIGDMSKPAEAAKAKVEEFKKAIKTEADRMTAEAKLAGDGKTKIDAHKAEPSKTEPDKFDLSNGKTIEVRKDTPAKGPEVPKAYDPGDSLKVANDAIKAAQENLKKVVDGQAALELLRKHPKMSAEAKPVLDAIAGDLANMKAADDAVVRNAKSYIENMNAVKEHTTTAAKDLTALVPKNDKVQEQVTKAFKEAAPVSQGWEGTQDGNFVGQKIDIASSLGTAQTAAQDAVKAAEKIRTTTIE